MLLAFGAEFALLGIECHTISIGVSPMRIYDLIAKKRDGGTHSREELEAIVNGFVRGEVADYQMAAWMMAVYLCGRRRRVPQRPCL